MQTSNKPDAPVAASLRLLAEGPAKVVLAMWAGSCGRTVRCVPTRRTIVAESGGSRWFGKLRRGRRGDAAREWHWLHVLPLLGIRTAEPLAWIGERGRTLLVTAAVPGRAMDAWAIESAATGRLPALTRTICRDVAPVVRRLHDRGLCHRDLYWNHLFCVDPHEDAVPTLLDVERVFAPRLRRRRWIVKDLAALWASVPVPVSGRVGLRFLRSYLGQSLRRHRALILAIVGKAQRIRGHSPRFG